MDVLDCRNICTELMDDPDLSFHELMKVLAGLRRLNWLSGTAKDLFRLTQAILPASDRTYHLLDLGCGSGDVVCDLVTRLLACGIKIEAVGADCNAFAVDCANNNALARNIPVKFVRRDAFQALT